MYWKLHDRPSKSNNSHRSWKPNNGQQQKGQGHANFTSSNQKNNENEIQEHGEFKFKKEDIERLKSLFESLEKPPSACSLAFSGKYSTSHVFNVSEATDHMTNSSHKFVSYTPCPSNKKISTTGGSLTTVAGQGEIHINPSPILKNVLHVAKLSTNLVSIYQLTKDMNCSVIFHPSHRVFQDQGSRKMIGLAKEKDRALLP